MLTRGGHGGCGDGDVAYVEWPGVKIGPECVQAHPADEGAPPRAESREEGDPEAPAILVSPQRVLPPVHVVGGAARGAEPAKIFDLGSLIDAHERHARRRSRVVMAWSAAVTVLACVTVGLWWGWISERAGFRYREQVLIAERAEMEIRAECALRFGAFNDLKADDRVAQCVKIEMRRRATP